MSYEPFVERFGELAWKETRSVTLGTGNKFGLPADDYGLMELYCNDENCDCRRVMFDVLSRKRSQSVAVIAYGWESASYYQKWYGQANSPVAHMAINEMIGLNLNSASQQSELAPAVLDMVRWLLNDSAYVARLKSHYQIFKEEVDPKHFRKSASPGKGAGMAAKSRKRHRPRSTDN
jgi:hypothetical protein